MAVLLVPVVFAANEDEPTTVLVLIPPAPNPIVILLMVSLVEIAPRTRIEPVTLITSSDVSPNLVEPDS